MSSHLQHQLNVPGIAPGNGYSQAVSGRGRTVAIAGQVGLDADGAVITEWEPQLDQVFRNLGLALRAAGAQFSDVVNLTYFLTDLAVLPALRVVRDRYVDTERPPASTAVQVAGRSNPAWSSNCRLWPSWPTEPALTGPCRGSGQLTSVNRASATAPAVATFNESTPGAIGIRTCRSARCNAASVSPAPRPRAGPPIGPARQARTAGSHPAAG